MRTLGIIGGFSPDATAQFYTAVVRESRKNHADALPHIIIWSVPLNISLERDLIMHSKGFEAVTRLLIRAAQGLERSGADVIVLPCNTLHRTSAEIQRHIHVPFLNIIDQSVAALKKENVRRVGLLGTSATLQSDLFQLRTDSIRFEKPPEPLQDALTQSIHRSVSSQDTGGLRSLLQICVEHFEKVNIRDVLLACTDFSGLIMPSASMRIHDTLTILAGDSFASLNGKFYFYSASSRRRLSP